MAHQDVADAELAALLARAAGAELLRVRRESGLEGKELGNAGDAAAQEVLAALLAEHRPHDAVLSEEAKDSAVRLSADRVWIIDPLDGTREFSEGRADWAVHVALWEKGELTLGVVAIPGEDLVLSSADTPEVPARDESAPLRLAVSRSRPPAVTEPVRAALDAELMPMGSAGVKIAAVARGQVDAYVHAGGQYEWDSAAPVAFARAAGLHTSRIDGSALVYNGSDPYLPDLVVCRPDLAPRILAAISDYTDGDL
ncbi:3'(2'),5'-bisphosphate nucleotidase CysQ [Demequina sp. SYSU T00192]|uniref:3'(2'),5-bisphosphonucleoside 3'(2')-phosphohydrolase n=1 Tax=Demequina litoralis TaxID=3051660 RepID=A0ABT8G7S3_9MICO|nr:3'(2'),5'-bisphosphate nucleotidase CysQ [Demequina sp. SYSU T00192]MDN4475173.1 3'(2'),5'-bisphosphate nucleotidase CysQ [Demequina sp. SYSU T00192]